MTPCLMLAIERVTLVDSGGSPGLGAFWIWGVGLAALSLILGGVISGLAWRDRRHADPEAEAFRLLAAQLGLPKPARRSVADLAASAGIPAVVPLLSDAAFDRAAAGREDPSLIALRRMLHSDR